MKLLPAVLVVAVTAACSDQLTSPPSVFSSGNLLAGRSTGPVDPMATWKIPLADAGLSLRSDHLYADGATSVYANGVCNVSAKIFATTEASNSGDATIRTSAATRGKCGRTFTLLYPDGFTETLASFNNLNELQNTSYTIPIGSTVARRMVINPGTLANNPSRCGKIHFGANGTVGAGSDSVLVTRIDASTWQVQSQAAPNDHALCDSNGQIYEMQVSFVVVSSSPLP